MRYALFLLIVLGQAAPPRDRRAPEAPDVGSASISGRITEQGSGQPIARAIVTLLAADRLRRIETIADRDGKYEFTGLRPGDYLLFAGPPEHRSTQLNQFFGDSSPSDVVVFPRSNLKLAVGEVRTDLDIALFRALAIEGRVVSLLDEPMANAEVRLTRANGTSASETAYTDDRGSFRLFGLGPGRYRLCVELHETVTDDAPRNALRLVRTCHPATTREADASEVVLSTADVSGIDVRLQMGATHSISGVVTRADGTPADGAFVTLRSKDRPFGSSSSNERSASGEFLVRGLTPGRYVLTASAGHTGARERDMPERIEMAFTEIDVTGDLANLHIALAKARTVPGRVVFEGDGAPASRSLVIHSGPARSMFLSSPGPPPSSIVDDNLKFQLPGIYRLPLVVGVRGLPEGWIVRAIRFGGRDITGVATDLGDPSTDGPLEITLTKRVAKGTIRVTDERGDPVRSCRVVILPADPARWEGAPWWNENVSAADGTLQLPALFPGEYLVAALEGSDFMLTTQPGGIDRIGKAATKIKLNQGDNPRFEVHLARIAAIDR